MATTGTIRRRRWARAGLVATTAIGAVTSVNVLAAAAVTAPPTTPLDIAASAINEDGTWVAGSATSTDGLHSWGYPVRQPTGGGAVESAGPPRAGAGSSAMEARCSRPSPVPEI